MVHKISPKITVVKQIGLTLPWPLTSVLTQFSACPFCCFLWLKLSLKKKPKKMGFGFGTFIFWILFCISDLWLLVGWSGGGWRAPTSGFWARGLSHTARRSVEQEGGARLEISSLCVFSYFSSNCLLACHIGCIWLTFLHCVFSHTQALSSWGTWGRRGGARLEIPEQTWWG